MNKPVEAIKIDPAEAVKDLPAIALSWNWKRAKEWIEREMVAPAAEHGCWCWAGDFQAEFEAWKRRIEKRVEERIRSDPKALVKVVGLLWIRLD